MITESPKINTPSELPALALAINEEHALAEQYASMAIHRANRAGELLNIAKAQVPHGRWIPWLTENCPKVSTRRAQEYMRLAREWPALQAKCADSAHLTIDGALKLLAATEPDKPDTAPKESFGFLPKGGETAYFRDDTWEFFIVESLDHPGFYWIARWMHWCEHGDMDDSDHNSATLKREEHKSYPYEGLRRPMSAYGVDHTLKSWKVADERWERLAPSEFNNDFIEALGREAEEDHRRKTWPSYCGSSTSNGMEVRP